MGRRFPTGLLLRHSFARYLVVGAIGFMIDAGGMEMLVVFSLNVYIARVISMTTAIVLCYRLHRGFTFAQKHMTDALPETQGRFQAFVVCQLLAALLNYGVFCVALGAFSLPWFAALVPGWPFLPAPDFFARMGALSLGVGAGLVANYILIRKVFVKGLRLPGFTASKP
jgi:putative flippase GtrA